MGAGRGEEETGDKETGDWETGQKIRGGVGIGIGVDTLALFQCSPTSPHHLLPLAHEFIPGVTSGSDLCKRGAGPLAGIWESEI